LHDDLEADRPRARGLDRGSRALLIGSRGVALAKLLG